MIYFDNAATSLQKPPAVARAVTDAMMHSGNSARAVHEAGTYSSRLIYETRELLCSFFNAERPDHVIFTHNATEALNTAIYGSICRGDHVITTELEHNSVLRPLYYLEKTRNIKLSVIPTDAKGYPDYSKLEKLAKNDAKVLIATCASNLTGNIVDIPWLGSMAKSLGLLFIVDASQTAGHIDIDIKGSNIDILCFTGHKGMLGPQGTGGMVINTDHDIRPLKSGGTGVMTYERFQPEQLPTRLEAGTMNSHGIAGINAAVRYLADAGLAAIHERELKLTRRFLEKIKSNEKLEIYGDTDLDTDKLPIVSVNVISAESGEISDILSDEYGIATRSGAHCAPLMHAALGTIDQGAVRFSFSHFNTEEEIDKGAEALCEIATSIHA